MAETQPLNSVHSRIHGEEKAKKRVIRSDSPPPLRVSTKKPWKTIFLVRNINN
jgi:hypothetical protein